MNKGAQAEVLFDYHAMNNGMVVSRPLEDIGYDRIVDHRGSLLRVQVKMTSYKQKGSWLVSTSGTNGRRYVNEFDVLAVYLKQPCVWMLIPFDKITGTKMKLSLTGKNSKYINNWDIFYAEK